MKNFWVGIVKENEKHTVNSGWHYANSYYVPQSVWIELTVNPSLDLLAAMRVKQEQRLTEIMAKEINAEIDKKIMADLKAKMMPINNIGSD